MSSAAQPSSETLEPGAVVRVRRAFPPGHTRTPWYVRGRQGVVERFVGRFPNPEALGYGLGPTPRLALYRVRFAMADVWEDYGGAADDSLDVEIYEHWLARP